MEKNNVPENIIWIDRGIIISLVYIILKKYHKLKDKYLIIRQNRIRKFLEFLFPKLSFINNEKNRYSNDSDSEEDHKDYFNFFIRSTPQKASNNYIVIDYMSNYNKIIPTNEIWLVPYYDKNDPLFFYMYEHEKDEYLNILDQYKIINHFTVNKRKNFKIEEHTEEFATWDLFFESGTIQRFVRSGDVQKSISLNQNPTEQFLYILNKYLNNVNFLNDYKPPQPQIIYQPCTNTATNIDVTYPIANLNLMKSIVDNQEPTIKEKEMDSSKMNQITKSVIKIIDKDNKKVNNIEKQKASVQVPIIQKEIVPESIDDLLDLFNEKILSLIKIHNIQND